MVDAAPVPDERMAMAYLSMAIGSGMNILVSGDGRQAMLAALHSLAPRHASVLTQFDSIRWGCSNTTRAIASSRMGVLRAAGDAVPDILVMELGNAGEARRAFSLARGGMGLIVGMQLRSRPAAGQLWRILDANQMGALDVHVRCDQGRISSITEYRWLQNAELDSTEYRDIAAGYRNFVIFRNGRFTGRIAESKLASRLFSSRLTSGEAFIGGLHRTAEGITATAGFPTR